MVFDRRFIAASPRYLDPPRTLNNKSDGLRPPLQDYCVLLTRSFLMVLDGPRPSPFHRSTPDDHHAFHEDVKPGNLTGQFPIRSFNSSNQFTTR